MFGFLKSNTTKKLQKQHALKLEQAMYAQRNGDIKTYSQLTVEAAELLEKINQQQNDK